MHRNPPMVGHHPQQQQQQQARQQQQYQQQHASPQQYQQQQPQQRQQAYVNSPALSPQDTGSPSTSGGMGGSSGGKTPTFAEVCR